MIRVYDPHLIQDAFKQFMKTEDRVDPIEWLANPDNIVLQNDRGDLGIFERGVAGYYSAHYWFKSRGRAAITAGTEFLDEIFNSCYNITVMTGFIPLTHLGARWLTRRLGLKSYGVIHGLGPLPDEMFIITRDEFNALPKEI